MVHIYFEVAIDWKEGEHAQFSVLTGRYNFSKVKLTGYCSNILKFQRLK